MRRSISTTSGRSSAASCSACVAVAGLADDLDLVAHVQQRRQRLAEQRLVVDEQHPHRAARGHPGTSTRSVEPAPGRRLDGQPAAETGGALAQADAGRTRCRAAVRRPPARRRAPPAAPTSARRSRARSSAPGRAARACGRWSAPPAPPGTATPRPRAAARGPRRSRSSSVGTPAAEVSSASAAQRLGQRRGRPRLAQRGHRPAHLAPAPPRPAAAPWPARRRRAAGSAARAPRAPPCTCICTTVRWWPSPSWMSRATRLRSCVVASSSAWAAYSRSCSLASASSARACCSRRSSSVTTAANDGRGEQCRDPRAARRARPCPRCTNGTSGHDDDAPGSGSRTARCWTSTTSSSRVAAAPAPAATNTAKPSTSATATYAAGPPAPGGGPRRSRPSRAR